MTTLEWLARLIHHDTTSHQSNLALIDDIEPWLKKHNFNTRRTYHPTQAKANLFATLPGKKHEQQGGLLFSGHTDVVPVEGQAWDTHPFKAVQKDNKVYGRGACDMKGFLAVMLACAPYLQRLQLSKPIHFAFSYDEEIGCLGAPLLIADLQAAGFQPAACIVGEPTTMQPVIAHKGIQAFHCQIHGKATHSSLTPQACNAIDYAAKLAVYLRQFADNLKLTGPFDADFDVPFTTLSSNKIHGGIATNIVPEHCELTFEFRNLPSVNPQYIIQAINDHVRDSLLPEMQKEYADASIEIQATGAVPAFEISPDTSVWQYVSKLTGDREIHKVAYATEAGLFQQAKIPTLLCGPGSIEQAHCPNEFIAIEQLERCEQLLIAMAENEAAIP